ncbi:hypothetical protein MTO96_031684 [Rhipicephalus appendiculatus]
MARNSQKLTAIWLTAIILVFSAWKCQGSGTAAGSDLEKIKKSCKPGEVYGCISGPPQTGCGENVCGVEAPADPVCNKICGHGCWCKGKMYRRQRDNKCVPKNECLM